MLTLRRSVVLFALLSTAASLAASCGGDDSTSASNECSCSGSQICRNGQCVDPTSDGGTDGSAGQTGQGGSTGTGGSLINPEAGDGSSCPVAQQCGTECCYPAEMCVLGSVCTAKQDPCTTNDDCWFDSYCQAGECVPYGVPADKNHDETCEIKIEIDKIVPAVQCRWTAPPDGDPYPNHFHVMSTPIVVDFNMDDDPKTLSPSIVFTTFSTAGGYKSAGVLRVISGKDCSHQFTAADAADATMPPASVAVGDIDLDGRAEIVAAAFGGGVIAFRWNATSKTFERLWKSGPCAGGSGPPTSHDVTGGSDKWSGPSIHDLDDDGKPEVIYGATVYSNEGCVVSDTLGFPVYNNGMVPVIADVDEDGKMELVLGNGLYEWDTATKDWVAEPYFKPGTLAAGQVAVADFGNFPLASQGNQDRAEIAVISAGTARVQTIEGTVIFGPVPIPGGGSGGLPTIADFDGDGRREFASAGGARYAVFDLDCVAGGDATKCGGQAKTDGVLWSQPSQDQSSNVTGSSVFDFDANGQAEAVYADECYLRVYEGATGNVIYSAARSSGTTYENPVIADVDGDYRTEIVSAVNNYASISCAATDPLFPTSTYETNHGIVILRDEQDRWAASRPVWNQHAYAVTNVGDLGQIPKTSAVKHNWKEPGLNNFRQNVQGELDALGEPDLTAGGEVGTVKCNGTLATVEARVCNRGTLPMVNGTEVAFYKGAEDGPVLCTTPIPVALQVGECYVVSCEADLKGQTVDVFVKVDPNAQSKECHENNNAAVYRNVACGKQPR